MTIEGEMLAARIDHSNRLLKEFFILVDAWSLSYEEQIKIVGEGPLIRLNERINLKAEVILDDQTIQRLVILMRIKSNIENLFPESNPSKLIRSKSRLFAAKNPLNIILGDPDSGLRKVEKILLLEKMNR